MESLRQSSTKCRKVLDRLSSLPGEVICHILSYLPTKTSVSTSILSKRWRFLWAHVPNLDLDSEDHHSMTSFSIIIHRVLMQHKAQTINTFRLRNTHDFDIEEFEAWLTTLISRGVRNIDMTLDYQSIWLPGCLFTCETLVYLRLNRFGEIYITRYVYLPSLKRLHLDMVDYEDDESLPRLLSGCPVLEELKVNRFVTEPDPDEACFYIKSRSLIKLVIRSDSCIFGRRKAYMYRLQIDTPKLRYIHVRDFVSVDISAGPLKSLIEAHVVLRNNWPIRGDILLYPLSVLKFVGSLSEVKCLHLSTDLLKVSDPAFSAMAIKFRNLIKLELAADWRFLSYFLGNADNLEVLIISKVDIDLKR